MTHQNDYTFSEDLVEKGLEAVPEMMRVLINQAMQVERSKYLQAENMSEQKNEKATQMGTSRRPFGHEWERSPSQFLKSEKGVFTLPLWKKDCGVNEPSRSPWPRCTFRESPPGE